MMPTRRTKEDWASKLYRIVIAMHMNTQLNNTREEEALGRRMRHEGIPREKRQSHGA